MKKFTIILTVALLTGGCQTTYEEQGTLIGAAAGGLLGNQIGDGSGQVLATFAGAVLGAIVGQNVGAKMDEVDRMKANRAYQHSLEYGRSGESTTWENPDSGNSGAVLPTRTYQTSRGQYCREFQQTITVGGKTEQAYGTACRQPDGSWKIVGG